MILADTVREHAAVVAVIIDTLLYLHDVVCCVAGHYGGAPVGAELVVVDTGAGVVAAWSAAAHLGSFEVWPGCDGFKDGASIRGR